MQNQGLEIVAATLWRRDDNRPLSLLLQALKGDENAKAWEFLATLFVARMPTDNVPKDPVFIPAPAQSPNRRHADFFARGLVRTLGGSVASGLQLAGQRELPTKKLSREARGFGNNFKWESLESIEPEQIVFVDDVLTTGSTAQRARAALPCKGRLRVWVLAYRQLDGDSRLC